jgi:hypothetical protein
MKETQPTPLRPESQVSTALPTPDPTLEGINPIQKQQIEPLTIYAGDREQRATMEEEEEEKEEEKEEEEE